MKTSFSMLVVGMAVSVTGFAQNYSHVAREAHEIEQNARRLSDVIHDGLHGSPFEQRLLGDAAELYRTAGRIEQVANRGGSVRQLEAEARLLSQIIDRLDRGVHEADEFAFHAHHGGPHCQRIDTRLVTREVHRLSFDVSNLQRDIEVLCRFESGYRGRPTYDSRPYGSYQNRSYRDPAPTLSFGNGRFSVQIGR